MNESTDVITNSDTAAIQDQVLFWRKAVDQRLEVQAGWSVHQIAHTHVIASALASERQATDFQISTMQVEMEYLQRILAIADRGTAILEQTIAIQDETIARSDKSAEPPRPH